MSKSEEIKARLEQQGIRYWAGDNISKVLNEGDKQDLIEELTPKFESVLDSLLIDRHNDPNSMDTGRRLAKMYINELMAGRYETIPNATAFPNEVEEGYKGMLVVRSEIISMCSHHHQTIGGVVHIGYIAGEDGQVIGLSKLNRIVELFGRRGAIQEQLTSAIHNAVDKITEGNKAIADDPGSVNTDPEGASWFFKLKIKDKGEYDSLMSKDEYDKFCKENPS